MTTYTRIIHVLGALKAGGAERFVVDLLVAQKAMGLPVELALLLPVRDRVGDGWASLLEHAGVPIRYGPSQNFRPPTVMWLRTLLKQKDVDLVHIHLNYVEAAYYLARFAHRRHYKVCRTIHNMSPPEPGLWNWAFHHSDIRDSISCGEGCHEAYQSLAKGSLTCIPYGVNFDWPTHDPARRDERQRALGLDPAFTHYMQVGRQTGDSVPTMQKAQDDLIKAWRQAELGAKGGRLHLIGEGALQAELEALAAGDDTIIFEGVKNNVHEWFAACDTHVMPSRFEGLPLAGIESVGTGIPAVFTDIPPLRELDSRVALFSEVGDIDALGANLEDRLGKRDSESPEHVAALRERFGIGLCARRYSEVYDRLS
ncbi:MAG: glycosyltransferase [Phycisphaerales bacterium]|nr:glycosyltransferase [Phycisphaerales bacterium]